VDIFEEVPTNRYVAICEGERKFSVL